MGENKKPGTQFIVLHETILRAWARDASTFALFAGLISIGILLDSPAMQWAGFFVAIITIMGRAGAMKIKRMTREEAIAYLQSQSEK